MSSKLPMVALDKVEKKFAIKVNTFLKLEARAQGDERGRDRASWEKRGIETVSGNLRESEADRRHERLTEKTERTDGMKSDAVAKLTIEVEKPLGELLESLRLGDQEVGERHSTRKPKDKIAIENAVADEKQMRLVERIGAKDAVIHGFKILFDYGGVGGLKDFHICDDRWDIELTAYYTLIAETPQFRPNDRLDAFAVECWCEMRGMDEEEAKRFVRWNSMRKWSVGEESTINELVEKWIDAMND